MVSFKVQNCRFFHKQNLSALPQDPGLLPKWQLIVSVMAVFNTIQNFTTLKLTRRIYNNVPSSSGQLPIVVCTLHNSRMTS